jgi:hypothetical protein
MTCLTNEKVGSRDESSFLDDGMMDQSNRQDRGAYRAILEPLIGYCWNLAMGEPSTRRSAPAATGERIADRGRYFPCTPVPAFRANHLLNDLASRDPILFSKRESTVYRSYVLEPTPVRVWQGHRSTIELH